jgi:hypothetical protein
MIVQMRTVAQAGKVAAGTGGAQLPGKPDRNGTPRLSRRVDVGADFEVHRAAVEAVSVLFTLFDDSGGEVAPSVPGPTKTVGTGHGADAGSPGAGGAPVRPRPAGPEAARPKPKPRKGMPHELQQIHTQRQRCQAASDPVHVAPAMESEPHVGSNVKY